MGAACCVATRDRTIQSGSTSEILHRNIRYSPTWSFRWDHRGRVAGEDTSINWFSDGNSRSDRLENKNESSYVSEDGSPLQNYQRNKWQKSPISEVTTGHMINSSSGAFIWLASASCLSNLSAPMQDMDPALRNISIYFKKCFHRCEHGTGEVKELAEPSAVSCPSLRTSSRSLPSTSLSVSPMPSQSHLTPSSSTPLRWPCHSSGHQLFRQVSDSRILGLKSPSNLFVPEERPVFPSWSNENGMRSCGGSSDNWSRPGFSELTGTSHMERWSFDSESFGFNGERLVRFSSRFSTSPVDLQTCGVCSKLLTEKSSWSAQKIIASNDLSVVSVLICGHVYHAECLESMTPEINKYDPACPICTFGEKQTLKLSEKALKAEMDLKARNKKSRNRIVDSDIDDDSIVFDHFRDRGRQSKGLRMDSSSSGRSSTGKPFLRKHFSFGSKSSKCMLDNPSRKKGFFWAKSSKE
ncbi:Zinc finger, RING-type [Sesbania bispinosa]|nr:Zinc finger, RING-type [Sesbania bispinosa]